MEFKGKLKGKVALVAGATRGVGRGIACMLGEVGATVYCTGRSVRGKPATRNRPETIEETANISLAQSLAHQLGKHKIAVVSLTPGFLRSEAMLDHFGVTEENWRDAAKQQRDFLVQKRLLHWQSGGCTCM